jgi:uncharacterized protein (TIGR00297 family)
MLIHLIVSIGIAVAISLLARRARSLSSGGMIAAAVIGTLALLAGWEWGVLLLVYFASSSALSRFHAGDKSARTAGIIEKGGERDALQVIANGGVFALAAALAVLVPDYRTLWTALGAGALAASASDTWATEIGTFAGGTPRSIVTFAPVAPGISGGVTIAGTVAAIAGAAFVALIAVGLGWGARIGMAAFIGGIAGSTLDSLLGATIQSCRWCDHCSGPTEQQAHDCGAPTRHLRGLPWFGNDAVNVVCGAAGGLLALAISG